MVRRSDSSDTLRSTGAGEGLMTPCSSGRANPRPPLAIERCRQEAPALQKAGSGASHLAACFRAGEPIPLKVNAA